MEDIGPSRTALRVAMRHATHPRIDDPVVFFDPLALRILGLEDVSAEQPGPKWPEQTPLDNGLRASVAIRSRYA